MNDDEWGFVFVSENCIQCHGCEVACKSWRSVALGVKWRRVLNLWHGRYPDVTSSSASVSCLHCVEPACVAVCPTTAISKRTTDGIVLVDAGKCTGCQACLDACPYGVPQFGLDGMMQKCDMCHSGTPGGIDNAGTAPPCVSTCPTQALALRKLTVPQKREAELSMNALLNTRSNTE
jgi:anaerobic dimethyl sulfoxide reductase subunit B